MPKIGAVESKEMTWDKLAGQNQTHWGVTEKTRCKVAPQN